MVRLYSLQVLCLSPIHGEVFITSFVLKSHSWWGCTHYKFVRLVVLCLSPIHGEVVFIASFVFKSHSWWGCTHYKFVRLVVSPGTLHITLCYIKYISQWVEIKLITLVWKDLIIKRGLDSINWFSLPHFCV